VRVGAAAVVVVVAFKTIILPWVSASCLSLSLKASTAAIGAVVVVGREAEGGKPKLDDERVIVGVNVTEMVTQVRLIFCPIFVFDLYEN
jgi:hypothetical protein